MDRNSIIKLLSSDIEGKKIIPIILCLKKAKTICEVGVQRGFFLTNLALCEPELLVGIDPWNSKHNVIYGQKALNKCYKRLLRWAASQDFEVRLIKEFSNKAVHLFPDNFFDFVYIDGDHTYDCVTEDLENWWKKVKYGGMLGGHGYWHHPREENHDVIRAVDGFIDRYTLRDEFYLTGGLHAKSFLILKTE